VTDGATGSRVKPFTLRGSEFVPVRVPAALQSLPAWGGGILATRRDGATVRVTTLERTLIEEPRLGWAGL